MTEQRDSTADVGLPEEFEGRLFQIHFMTEPDARARAFAELCAAHPHLEDAFRGALERLSRTDEMLGRVRSETGLPAPREQPAPRRLGPYELTRPIGRGGFGEVWLAEQSEPLRRRVALKLLAAGPGHDQAVARFELERHALSLLQHENVARVHDAGVGPDGRPYFVMEYVDGQPLTAHCDAAELPIAERLALFLAVCAGVQHAHQKGLLHRDLKPSNILVALQDGRALPKIIDFGIAKASPTTCSPPSVGACRCSSATRRPVGARST